MEKIWKFQLRDEEKQVIEMPEGTEILSVAFQGETIYLWGLVDPDGREREERVIRIVPTGQPFTDSENCMFIGTCQRQTHGVFLVLHVFEEM